MELKSMKIEKSEKEPSPAEAMYGSSDRPEYPWGLTINLDEDSLKKLGITSLPAVGSEMKIEAKVKISSTSSNEYDSGVMRSMSLQITEMGIGGDSK